jgi:hypothetical protein
MRRLSVTAAVVTALVTLAAAAGAQHGRGGAGASGHQAAQACLTEFEKVVGEGRGFGMAFAADQNGYPGPMHVLELRERLKLSPDQETKARELMHAMFAESRPKSAERLRADVRLVHLLTHLKTRELLTETQRRIYHEARAGAR